MVSCHDLSVLGCEANKIERVTKELFLLFSRDRLILDKQVTTILFKLFLLFLSITISPLVLVFLLLVLLC